MDTPWTLRYDGYDPGQEQLREALCTLGNGYVATRGAAPECTANDAHHPGTYLAGTFNRLETTLDGVTVSNECMVNQPNWLALQLHTPGEQWFSPDTADLVDYWQELDLRAGLLTRHVVWTDARGRRTTMTQRRFVHMQDPHLAGLQTTVVADNWSGDLAVRSGLDGRVGNTLVERYQSLDSHHHDVVQQEQVDDETVLLVVETNQSRIRVAEAARTRVHNGEEPVEATRTLRDEQGWIGHDLTVPLEQGRPVTIDKIVAIHRSGDRAISEPADQAVRRLHRAQDFDWLAARQAFVWEDLWDRFQLEFNAGDPEIQKLVNLHAFHTLQTASPNSIDLDVSVPARGLHGEAYRGHIFWDEVFVLPFLTLRLPALTRSLLLYRFHRLDEARHLAREAGFDGAMFPWQSGSDGSEETQQLHLNPRSGRWLDDHSHLQRHVNHAIAFNLVHFAQVTADSEFIRHRAGPMLIEIARFLASITSYDRARDRYRILKVMGPDEFHEAYPDAEEPGLDDNAYTNVMTVWVLLRVRELLDSLPEHRRRDLCDQLELGRGELDHWETITRKMYVPFHDDGIISQFEGYEDLEELDWDAYRERYDNIQRLDRILEAEGDSPNRYKLAKQADVLMLFYLLTADELGELFGRLGYDWDPKDIPRTIDYYLARTSHGSTLSTIVHSWLLARRDRTRSWHYFEQALRSDVGDVQGGTTAEGIHLGVMTGTLDLVQRGYTGVVVHHDVLWVEPALPEPVDRLEFSLHYRTHRLELVIDHREVRISAPESRLAPVHVGHRGEVRELQPGHTVTFMLDEDPSTGQDEGRPSPSVSGATTD